MKDRKNKKVGPYEWWNPELANGGRVIVIWLKKKSAFREEVEQFYLGGAFSVGPPICGTLEAGKVNKTKPLETRFLPQKYRA